MRKIYYVQSDWFPKRDKMGNVISTWYKQISPSEVMCVLCKKNINCLTKGFAAVMQHSFTGVHKDNVDAHKTQMTIVVNKKQEENLEKSSVLKSVQCKMAANISDDFKRLFDLMIPGCVPQGFGLSDTKQSYLITEAVGPYFYKELINEMKNAYFSPLFDETTNNENKKELLCVFGAKRQKKLDVIICVLFFWNMERLWI